MKLKQNELKEWIKVCTFIIMAVVAVFPALSQAAITLDEKKQVALFGDVRLRAEIDERSGSSNTDRERLRIRARLGLSYKPNDKWSGRLRLATSSNSLNSPHTTLGTTDTNKNDNFGIDQAYINYHNGSALDFRFGKMSMNYWQQNELFWDTDINPEGVALVYKASDALTFNAAYVIVSEGNWGDDVTLTSYQAVYKSKVGLPYTLAVGGASVSGDDNLSLDLNNDNVDEFVGPLQSDSHWMVSGQIKPGPWLLGVDYLSSNASSEDTAYVVQGRYKLNDKMGLRLYYYHVEAFAPLGDGIFSQDNWPNPGNTGVSNFEGFRYQFDYKLGKNTKLDIRYYDAERIVNPGTLPGTTKDALMGRNDHSRLQVNLNIKF